MDEGFGWFAIVAVIAVGVALVTRQRGWGMALPLIAAGAVVSIAPIGPSAPPQPEVILVMVLAPLVFGESLSSSYVDLRQVRTPVLALAIGLVLTTTFAVGFMVSAITPLPLAGAGALGAILAPTDAVAVSSVARKAGLPRRLVAILEGESLVNDGTGLTLLRVAVVGILAGAVSDGDLLGTFAIAVTAGVVVGLVAAYA